jgi:hypothetical protein
MRCNRVRRLIPLGAGRDLEPELQAAVELHLRSCLSCYREFRAVRASLAAFATLADSAGSTDVPSAPLGLAASIMDAVRAGVPGPAAPVRTWGERARFALPLAATFIAFALAGFYLFGGGPSPSQGDIRTIHVPTEGMVVGYTGGDRMVDVLPATIEIPRHWFAPGARAPAFDANEPIPVTTVPPVRMTHYAPRRGF